MAVPARPARLPHRPPAGPHELRGVRRDGRHRAGHLHRRDVGPELVGGAAPPRRRGALRVAFALDDPERARYVAAPLCGTNSVVECNLAKVEVEGSNPLSRSRKN